MSAAELSAVRGTRTYISNVQMHIQRIAGVCFVTPAASRPPAEPSQVQLFQVDMLCLLTVPAEAAGAAEAC